MLELADELVAARLVLHRLTALEAEIAHDREIVARAPELAASISERRAGIEEVARDLEAQWVDQGPLVSLWQRAVELAELAEGSGADSAEHRADVDQARLRVETARLVTRDTLDRLCSQREVLVDVLLAAPFDLPTPAPVRDDGRPEAGRRDALALLEAVDAARPRSSSVRRASGPSLVTRPSSSPASPASSASFPRSSSCRPRRRRRPRSGCSAPVCA